MPILLSEMRSLFQRRDARLSMLGIWLGVTLAGLVASVRWSLWRIEEAASLIEAHEGYLGVYMASSSQASLLINLIERNGGPFVRRLSMSQGTALIDREFTTPNRLTHIDQWPALQRFEVRLPARTLRVDVIIETSCLLAITFIGGGISLAWLMLQAGRRAAERRRLENLLSERLGAMAHQVAHDIRAPLAALDTVMRDIPLPPHRRMLADRSAARLQAIADGLLSEFRRESRTMSPTERVAPGQAERYTAIEPARFIRSITEEKLAQYRDAKDLRLTVAMEEEGQVFIMADPAEIERVLSNLIDNAVQAMRGRGTVVIRFERMPERWISISIEDSGPGIPPAVMPIIGQRGATFGKEGGTGLGLWHAKTTVESWGGRLEIQSEIGKGTTVRLILPRAEAPAGEPAGGPADAVLIDDDPLVRMSWAVAAKRAGKALRAYADADSFIKESDAVPRGTPLYIDSDLGSGAKGEEIARRLSERGFTELILATGHDSASFPPLPHLRAIRGKEPPWPSA